MYSPVESQAQKNSVSFFIAQSGNDNNTGTINEPFKTFKAVATVISALREPTTVSVYFREGTYSFTESLVLSDKNENNIAEIILSGYKNEKVELTGGIELDNNKFQLAVGNDSDQRLAPTTRGKIYVTDLTSQGITNFGSIKKNGFRFPKLPAPLELFINDEPMVIARWPNDSLLAISGVIQKGDPKNIQDKVMPVFTYNSSRPTGWAKTDNIWVAGQFAVGWAFDNIPVSRFDPAGNAIYLADHPSYGVYSSDDNSTNVIKTSARTRGFYFYNILQELDSPGEWYLDTITKKMFIWPRLPLKECRVQVSLLEVPLFVLSKTHDITIKNLNFSCTRGVIIQADHSSKLIIENCTFKNNGLQAIIINSGSGNEVINCQFQNQGAGGIGMTGGERKTLTPGNNIIKNCEFSHYSRLYKSYSPAVSLGGVGNKILNCYIHDAPDQAILFSGNNHFISNNHIQNVCTGFTDMGAIYTGRDPSSTGTVINNNFFEHITNPKSSMVAAIYIDDGSGGIAVNNNLFLLCGTAQVFGAVHINGGGNNNFLNNIFIDCGKAFSNTSWSDSSWAARYIKDSFYVNQLLRTVDIRSDIYQKSYPWLKDFFDTVHISPRINFVNNTICYNIKIFSSGNGYKITDSLMINVDPGFIRHTNKHLQMPSPPLKVSLWKDWSPIDVNNFGPQTTPATIKN